ncbi:hypothetical protein H3222_18665 [Pseudomonas chengduensis]|nr:hypothetical protein [Pseudomonas chengduensis]MBG0847230.1 hypothetical protein [Pseudomonas chengduensis]
MAMFFEEISTDIEAYCKKLETLFKKNGPINERVALCAGMLRKIAATPKEFDKSARLNIKWIGDELRLIILDKKIDDVALHDLCQYLSRIARESNLRSPYKAKSPELELLEFFDYGKEFDNLSDKENSDFIWASIPKYIATDYLEGVSDREKGFLSAKDDWEAVLQGYKATIDSYVSTLKEQRGKFNFVYLSKAFHEMHSEKKGELQYAFFSMIFLGVVVVMPLVYQFVVGGLITTNDGSGFSYVETGKILSLLGLEVALLYFFRIALKNYYSVKAQLLQLELRLSLCGFIESYADFAKSRKTKDVDPLSKFESIIFSGITPDEGNVPSTFDGVDQLLKIAKEIRAK